MPRARLTLFPGSRDWGRLLARVLCVLFGLVGALPLGVGLAVRSDRVRAWAAGETARVLEQELGIRATYTVAIELLPPRLALGDLTVPASDGGAPAFTARRVAVAPRPFALLSGRLDAGDIEIEEPRARLVLRDGRLANVDYRLPESSGAKQELPRRLPFGVVAVSDARVDLDAGGLRVVTGAIDVDVVASEGPALDVTLRAGETTVVRTRRETVETEQGELVRDAVDEDVLCRLELAARLERGSVLVRRLSLLAMADEGHQPGTSPTCAAARDERAASRVAVRLSQTRVAFEGSRLVLLDGHVVTRGPVRLVNRFVRFSNTAGWVAVAGDVRWDGSSRLPAARLRVRGGDLVLGDTYRLGKYLDAEVEIDRDVITAPKVRVGIADADAVVTRFRIAPFERGVPLSAARVDATGTTFPGLMRDLGVTEDTLVAWDLDVVRVTDFGGTLSPLALDGDLYVETSDFEVTDRAWHDPNRQRMVGVESALVRGKLGVRPDSFLLYDQRATFGRSDLHVRLVDIGFSNTIRLVVDDGSEIDLADISPLAALPIAGRARIGVMMSGASSDPLLTGTTSIRGLELSGFPLGDITSSGVRFRPLAVDFLDVRGKKGRSELRAPVARLAFDAGSSVLVDAVVESDSLDFRDFFHMWHFDEDPRFDPILGQGAVRARVHYDLGGRADRCGGGLLEVDASMDLAWADLFEERYDGGKAELRYRWFDRDASYQGMEVDVPGFTLRKGSGTMLGEFTMRRGAVVRARAVGTSLPLSRFQSLGRVGPFLDGTASAVAEVGGTLDALEARIDTRISPVRVGRTTWPSSRVSVRLEPVERERSRFGTTRCGLPKSGPFDRSAWDADRVEGTFYASGKMFGDSIDLGDLRVTRQRSKHVQGTVRARRLQVGALAELLPALSDADSLPIAWVSGSLRFDDLPLAALPETRATLTFDELHAEQGGAAVDLVPGRGTVAIADGAIRAPGLALEVRTASGIATVVDVSGGLARLATAPFVDATVELRPTGLAALAALWPSVERASGTLSGKVQVSGAPSDLVYQGGLALTGGEIALRGVSTALSDLEVALVVDSDEVRVERGSARLGSGTVALSGSAPLRGFELGAVTAMLRAREIVLPASSGVRAVLDADLAATWPPPSEGEERALPRVEGEVTFRSLEYTRPLTMVADLDALAKRGKRSSFESWDPDGDRVAFDVTVRAARPLVVQNELVETSLILPREGVTISGTNQRFGARGTVRLAPGGRIRLRQNEFEIVQGTLRFDDPSRITPEVDVTAVTEYRRYSSATQPAAGTSTGSASATAATGGRWRISMHAYGDPEDLRVDLTSEPALAQDDIFLLLAVGLTRAELDQAQSASVGGSVALETLGTLSGAGRAVTQALPVIDEFRFGSDYSSRTGRTEPTVTIGKRLAERLRANVTTGLAESSEVRSNVELQLTPRLSVEGSYDNVNDISSNLGNLGANLRWRLEFE
ncbi:MAG: translocation/assembly module TamB domain-containing protein [Polyangiaceae bacterium]|nr:translocation/assembly module TamB domain-containing protein [Polyangiaceae bacterium]